MELRKVLAATGARIVDAEVAVAHAPTKFDEDGQLVGEAIREQLAETAEALLAEAGVRLLVAV